MNFIVIYLFPFKKMLADNQNTVIYLMLLNGLLFLGLNFAAYSIIFPGPPGSRRIGYLLIVAALSALFLQQEFQALFSLGLTSEITSEILIAGFVTPVFFISLVYYRIKKNRSETPTLSETEKENHETD